MDRNLSPAQEIAWSLQVHLATWVGVSTLGCRDRTGSARAELATLFWVFTEASETLRAQQLGEGTQQERVRTVGAELLHTLRAFLDRWHPQLAAHEESRGVGVAAGDHEGGWEHRERFWDALADLAEPLHQIQAALGEVNEADLEPLCPAEDNPAVGTDR